MITPPNEELLALCDQLLDGELSPAGRSRLEALVLGEAALRTLYVEYMQLHGTLRQQSSRLGDVALEEVMRSFPVPKAARRRPVSWIWKVAAAFVLGAGLPFGLWLAQQQAVVATLVETPGARWENNSLPTAPGSRLQSGRLHLAEGLARMVFRSGVELTLEGPAELELINGGLCRLYSGALVAHVPEGARGFTVQTDNGRLIDHGTDFGIRAGKAGQASVYVLKGEVELRHDRGGAPMRLVTRQAATIDPRQLSRTDAAEGEPGQLSQPENAGDEFTHEITTASGNGAAAYITSPGTLIHFSENLLLVKNVDTEQFLRKAFLRFDLAPLGRQRIDSARLTLHFDPSGFGFAALSSDTVFAVYGVTDDSQDDWTPKNLTWQNAPAFAPAGGMVDTAKATKLGTFKLPRGVLRGTVFIEGENLVKYLTGDANQHVSLVVVSETLQSNSNGVVYGFAGNYHPTLPPPTLRLKIAR